MVCEVESEHVGVDFRTLLVCVFAESRAERGVEQVGRGVRARDRGAAFRVDGRGRRRADFERAGSERSNVNDKLAVILRRLDVEDGVAARDDAALSS